MREHCRDSGEKRAEVKRKPNHDIVGNNSSVLCLEEVIKFDGSDRIINSVYKKSEKSNELESLLDKGR